MTETCTDCGFDPIWWYSRSQDLNYCRRCHEKNGYYRYPSVDPDDLARWLREHTPHTSSKCEELALDLLRRCAT